MPNSLMNCSSWSCETNVSYWRCWSHSSTCWTAPLEQTAYRLEEDFPMNPRDGLELVPTPLLLLVTTPAESSSTTSMSFSSSEENIEPGLVNESIFGFLLAQHTGEFWTPSTDMLKSWRQIVAAFMFPKINPSIFNLPWQQPESGGGAMSVQSMKVL